MCDKPFSTWVRKVLCVAKAHMILGMFWGFIASAVLAAGISEVSILQDGDLARVSTTATHIFLNIPLQQISARIWFWMLFWVSGLQPSVGKCLTLTLKSCRYVGCQAIAFP